MLGRAALVVSLCLAATTVLAMDGNVQFVLGERDLDESWRPVDQQGMFGVQVDMGEPSWPVRLVFAGFISADQVTHSRRFAGFNVETTGAMIETSAGGLWLPVKNKSVHPYLGAGLTVVTVALDFDRGGFSTDDTDSSVGVYANGGLYFRLGERFNLGLDARVVRGTNIDLFGLDGDADYEQIGMVLGFSWGAQ